MREIDNRIVCSNEYSKIAEIEFGTCHYFGDHFAHDFVTEKRLAEEEYVCYDWVAFNRGGKHKIGLYQDRRQSSERSVVLLLRSDRWSNPRSKMRVWCQD